MNRRKLGSFALCAMLLVLGFPADAQQPAKVPRIGYLVGASFSTNAARIEAFRHGLRELSYVEGKNIIIDWRSAEGKSNRLPELAADLVRLGRRDRHRGAHSNPRRQGSNFYYSHCHDERS